MPCSLGVFMSTEYREMNPRVLAVRRDTEGRTVKVTLVPRPGSWAVVWERDGTQIDVREFASKRDAVDAAFLLAADAS